MKEKLVTIASINKNAEYLVVGESHYFNDLLLNNDNDTIIDDWYSLTSQDFIYKYNISDEHIKWFDTQWLFEDVYDKYKKGQPVDRSKEIIWILGRALCQHQGLTNISKENISNKMQLYDFTNYYVRPSLKTGKQINDCLIDKDQAWKNFNNIIEKGKYKKIFILSAKVGKQLLIHLSVEEIEENNIILLTHPASVKGWGYKNSEGFYQKLLDNLSSY